MKYSKFAERLASIGLVARKCSPYHWQIRGGTKHPLVNVWANSRRGFRFQVDGLKSRDGTLIDAIKLAGPRPVSKPDIAAPWEEAKPEPASQATPERVGLIRWLWRLIW